MAYEVELKYRLHDRASLLERLIVRGARSAPAIYQEDHYLSHPARDFQTTREALRIRRIGDQNRITYKGPRLDGPTKTREEIEIAFTEGARAFDDLVRLWQNLGFRPIATIRKERQPLCLRYLDCDLEIAIDSVVGLGDFVEIEAIAALEWDVSTAQTAVIGLAAELCLAEPEPRSYLKMTLELQ
jgi:adenylate cyclase class 2